MAVDKVRRALEEGLRLCGFSPEPYDVDAIIGRLHQSNVYVMDADQIHSAMFDDRCDFECTVCHPTEDIEDESIIDERGNPL